MALCCGLSRLVAMFMSGSAAPNTYIEQQVYERDQGLYRDLLYTDVPYSAPQLAELK
jgi:hypothetical protein